MSEIVVKQLTEHQPRLAAAYDSYIMRNGLPTQLSGWQQVMRATYGYETYFLLACAAGRPVGALPLFLVRSRLLGNRLSTPPGGMCADTPEAAAQLKTAAQQLARKVGAERVVLQDSRVCRPQFGDCDQQHVAWQIDLPPNEETLWQQIDGNLRRQVRKARRNDLRVEHDHEQRLVEPFYEVFSRFAHQAGTPLYARRFVEQVSQAVGGQHIAVVWHGRQPVAAYFQLELNDVSYGMWGAALSETLRLRPTHLAIWEIMAHACRRGLRRLDMGRSPIGSGAANFKEQWGGSSLPVYQQVMALRGNQGNVSRAVQQNGAMLRVRQLWPKLPYPVAKLLGPQLRRHIPFA